MSGAEVRTIGRKRKFDTPEGLLKAVDDYFRSLSYETPVTIRTMKGEKKVPVREWVDQPSLAGLCLFLGISRETWRSYGGDPKLRPVTERARLTLEEYWMHRLDGKGAHGAKFVLTNNFGWSGVWRDSGAAAEGNGAGGEEDELSRSLKELGGRL